MGGEFLGFPSYRMGERAHSTSCCAFCEPELLQALRLQLGNLQREGMLSSSGAPEPSTSRSFHTARSVGSSRSGRSKHSKEKKEKKERKSKETRMPEETQEEAA